MRFCSGGADASGCAWLLLLVSRGAMRNLVQLA